MAPTLTNHTPPTTAGNLQLVVAWTAGKKAIGRAIKVTDAVGNTLRKHADAAVASLINPASYAPDADLEDNSHFEADRDTLFDEVLLQELSKGASLPLATKDELKDKNLTCHAVLFGHGKNRSIFVRKRSPIQLARKSVVATLFDGSLDWIQTPIFAFDDRYDAIITADRIYILNKNAFEGMFKDSAAVLAKTGDWVNDVAQTIPMVDGSSDTLVSALNRNQFYRRKFLAVRERPHIKAMTPQTLKDEIARHGYDLDDLMVGDKLKVTESNVKLVLQLLNEDLFTGGFSRDRYAAGSKRTRP